ncbi:MAG: hypothetical protein ACP5VE_05040 [Chthonomonadales bacterium]
MTTVKWLVAACCTGMLAVGGLAAAQDKAVQLSGSYKAGEVARYKYDITAQVSGTEVPAYRTIKETVKEIKPNGDVVVLQQDEGGKYVANGQDNDLQPEAPATITFDKAGKLVSFTTNENEGSGFMETPIRKLLAVMTHVYFPNKAVAPSDAWQTEVDNPAVKGKKVVIKTTYLGTDTLDGVQYWKVKQSASAAVDAEGDKMATEFTYWLDPANGAVVKGEGSQKGVPTQYGPMDLAVKITRVKPSEEAKPTSK